LRRVSRRVAEGEEKRRDRKVTRVLPKALARDKALKKGEAN
jgi:hypothetical protein